MSKHSLGIGLGPWTARPTIDEFSEDNARLIESAPGYPYGEPCESCEKPIVEVPWYSSGMRCFCSEECRSVWRKSKGFDTAPETS